MKEKNLLIMPSERPALREALKAGGLRFVTVSTCREARQMLATLPGVEVVITAMSLQDGNWATILQHLVQSGSHAELIVAIPRRSDAEPLQARGVFEVLRPPYEADRVRSVVWAAAGRRRSAAQA